MRGTSSPLVKLIGDFDSAIEVRRIGDCFSFHIFREHSQLRNFRLLQQYLPTDDIDGLFDHRDLIILLPKKYAVAALRALRLGVGAPRRSKKYTGSKT
jgi:hypothetical protein